MFPVERSAVLNDIAREIRGHPLGDNEGRLLKLLNEDAITKIASNTWKKCGLILLHLEPQVLEL